MEITAKPFEALDAAKQADGLIPAIIQDARTLRVLMLGYMNREAYEKSLSEGRVTFYSRTRRRLWTKGETSGNYLDIVSVTADCDNDTLLIRAIPHGPTCHTGAASCFDGAAAGPEGFIRYLQGVIQRRHAEMPSTGCVRVGMSASSPRSRSLAIADEASPTPGRSTLSACRSTAASDVTVNSAPMRRRALATERRLPVS